MKIDFKNFELGAKVQCYDKDGYYIMNICGIVSRHLGGGHAIIKSFEGGYRSTIGESREIVEIERI